MEGMSQEFPRAPANDVIMAKTSTRGKTGESQNHK